MKPAVVFTGLLLASCASSENDAEKNSAASASGFKNLSQRMEESNGFKVDADGTWKPRSDKRSSFESQGANAQFKGEYAKKEFKTGEYSRKSWWGEKAIERKTYTGNTDGSRFQTASRYQHTGAREAGNSARLPGKYQTGSYATDAAREAGQGAVSRTSDAETDLRRNSFEQPAEYDYREQRAMSLEQSKGILGR